MAKRCWGIKAEHPKAQRLAKAKVRRMQRGLGEDDYPKDATIRVPSVKKRGTVAIPVTLLDSKRAIDSRTGDSI